MTMSAPLRRLIDLPGVNDLELKALMKPRYADEAYRSEFPDIDDCARTAFGLSVDEAEAVALPADWDGIDRLEGQERIEAFEAEGWDVTSDRRKPLRMLDQFALPLALAIRGVAGELPFQPDDDTPEPWGAGMAAEAARFRKR
jgi:hypothetical protein